MFVKLNEKQIADKINYVREYMQAKNAASGSAVDANANVTSKNICTLMGELHKDFNIQLKRSIVYANIQKMFGKKLADEYLRQLGAHEIYAHDESSLSVYTYASKESVMVNYNGEKYLVSMDNLYSIVEEEEILLDSEKGVWGKYPHSLEIYDSDGKMTKVSRIVKKIRHRDLYRVKTAFGEDVYVTDNHPMITSKENINETVEAIKSEGAKQFREKIKPSFSGKNEIDLTNELVFSGCENYGSYIVSLTPNIRTAILKKTIDLNEKLGYVVGFFIAEGYLSGSSWTVVQKDSEVLKKVASYLYDTTGASTYLSKVHNNDGREDMYQLTNTNELLVRLFKDVFGICKYSENKNLPINIFEYNKEFARGVVAGIIDGDGTKSGKFVSIRVSSRALISQLTTLLSSFDVSTSNGYQCQNFGCNLSYKSNYPLFGITINQFGKNEFPLSFKAAIATGSNASLKKTQEGETYIQSVTKMDNEFYLKQNEFIYDLTTETSTFLMNNILVHNCLSATLYPFLTSGMESLGGEAKAPKHLASFCGNFVNLCFALSSQVAGALGTPEFLMCFDYFARKDYGNDYADWFTNPKTDEEKVKAKEIENHLQSVVYALNQPAAARGFQSIFWNISIFDKYYFEAIFEGFMFPDFTPTNWTSLEKLQKFFMGWFNKERTKALLTFPVVTASILTEHDKPKDEEFARFLANEMASGNSFFMFMSKNPYAISSCCRLSSEMTDTTFSNSSGAGGVSTGSMNVITMNVNRLVQDSLKGKKLETLDEKLEVIKQAVKDQTLKIHQYQIATKAYFDELKANNMLPIYDAGFVQMKKQFLTVGINGVLEGAEFLGIDITVNEDYKKYLLAIFETIETLNREAKKTWQENEAMFNLEMVPGENLGVKFAGWDKKDGYVVKREFYNSYLYKVEDSEISIIDKMKLYSGDVSKFLSGGSAVHLNLEEYADEDSYYKLMCVAAKLGVPYWCQNVAVTCCEENGCKHINKHTTDHCVKCGSKNVTHATRIIGYLKRVSSFSSARQREASLRYYTRV